MTWWQWVPVILVGWLLVGIALAGAFHVGRRRQKKRDAELSEWIREYDEAFHRGTRAT